MATKAETVRAEQQHKGVKPKKRKKLVQRKPHVHHESKRLEKNKATYALEDVAPGKRPPRKSSRRASNHAKPDANLRRRTTRTKRSPKERAGQRKNG
jgi:hypothetical protein